MASIRLAAIVESSDDAIVSKDLSSIVTSWNRGAENIFGYTADEMVGTSILRLIPMDRQGEEKYIMGKINRGERLEHFDTVRQTKDGRLIDVSVTVSPIKDATGKVIGVSKLARNITERKQLEHSLARVTQARKLMGECNRVLVHASDEAQLLDDMCKVTVSQSGYQMAWIGVPGEDTERRVLPVAQAGDNDGLLRTINISWSADSPHGSGPMGTAIRTGSPCVVRDMLSEDHGRRPSRAACELWCGQ